MNDEYSEAFKSIIPGAPTSDGWADGARRKRRNRRRVLTGGAGVAVFALAVPFALSLQSQSMLVATPGESNTASPVMPHPAQNAPGAAACWEASGDPRKPTEEGATDGAIRAWLCGDAGAPESFPGAVGPLEPLMEGVDELVEFIQKQEDTSEVECPADAGTDYRVVLEYGDGSRRVVAGELYGCGVINDGGRSLTGAQKLYDRALELWGSQRERVVPPAQGEAVAQCRPSSRSVVPDLPPAERPMFPLAPTEAVAGFTCVEDPEAEYQASVGFTLDSDVVAAIAESVMSDSEEGMGRNHVPTWVTLAGPWGEALTLQGVPEGTFQWFDGDGTPMLWTPSAEVLTQLAPALEPPDAEASPGPVPELVDRAQPESCVGVTRADAQASTLEDGSLPPAPERISLCGNGATVGPWEPLVAADLTSRAVEAFNALGEVDPESTCSAEAGNSHLVVLEYPDGTDRVLEVGLLGCRGVRTGDQVRSGGADYLDTLIGLWEEQRGAQPAVADRPGQLCPQVWSAFEIDPLREEFTHGRACIGWEREGATMVGPAEESVLPAELVADLSAQLGTMTTVENWGQLSGDSLVLITAAGDPFKIQRIDGEGFLVSDDVEDRVWIPTGDVAERLETIFSN